MARNKWWICIVAAASGFVMFAGIVTVCVAENRRFNSAYRILVANPTIEQAKGLFKGPSETFVDFDAGELRFRGLKNVPDNVNPCNHHALFVTWMGIPQHRVFVFYDPGSSNVIAVECAKW